MTPIVQPIAGETLRFRVRSRTDLCSTYLVDLAWYDGNGCCTCLDHECKRWPLIRDGARPSDRTRCWHVRRAREFVTDLLIASLINQEKPKKKL